jgi:hypothetical protein
VTAADYVGPKACRECHEAKYDAWRKNLHASMNQLASPSSVEGDFAQTVTLAGGSVTFTKDDGAFAMAFGGRRYHVTRTIGTRSLQEYVGVPDGGGPEIRLPFGWWLPAGRWFPRRAFDSWESGDPFAADTTPWAARCAWCHNTYPFELRAQRTLHDPPLGEGLEQYFDFAGTRDGAIADGNMLPVDRLVTVGISCESCHLGGRDHVASRGDRPPSFLPVGADLKIRKDAPDLRGGRANPIVVDTICAQCHSTPTPRWPDGSGQRNSSEALDLARGACRGIKCTDCHDPHVLGPVGGRAADACQRCHSIAPDHGRGQHDATQVSCVDCHMPKIVQGIAGDQVRSHRISSPKQAIASGTPDACGLCHLDRSRSWIAAALNLPDPGDDTPVGERWLASADPAVRMTAAAAYARAGDAKILPRLIPLAADPEPYVRARIWFAIRALGGSGSDPLSP